MINFIYTPDFQLRRDAAGRLWCTDAHGQVHAGIVPVRAFPLAAAQEFISLVGSDGHELVLIERLADVPAGPRALLEEELALRDFVPEIQRLVGVSSFGTPSVWTVETDRGPTTFVLKGEEDIRRLKDGALLIAASEGVHYRIADMAALDRPSRKLLERFL